ncbi:MAG: hypothetical protein U0354_07875 [Candidatus Sericytochromatia bacterium]
MSKEKDHIWKRIIDKFFNKFAEFFLPDLHKDIDFTHKPKFLDNQLLKITQKSGGKDRESDKLVEVKLKDGTERFILIHVEVQDSRKPDFSFRMFQYHYRIFDKFNKKVVALAIYTDINSKFKPNEYKDELYGTGIRYWFNTYKVLEQKDKKEILKNSDNPFSLVILASLYYLESKDNDNKRYNFKIELTKLLLEKGYKRKDIYELFEFIDILLKFNDDILEEKYIEEINKVSKTKEKEIISPFKRITRKEEKKHIAINLLKEGSKVEFVSKVTGLTIVEVEELKKNLK